MNDTVVDDFSEFLGKAYAPLLAPLAGPGLSAQVSRGGTAQYALTVARPGDGLARVEVTDGNRPLPQDPADVERRAASPARRPATAPRACRGRRCPRAQTAAGSTRRSR
jgi:hypothetical protein